MIKLIVTDIDGTLVPDGTHDINPEIFEVIHNLIDQGIMFVAASGRQHYSMKQLFEPVADRMMFISEGGGIVWKQDEIISAEALEQEKVNQLVKDIFMIPECDAMVCGVKRVYVAKEESSLYRWMKEDYKYDIEAVGDLTKDFDDDIVKVSVYHKDNAEGLTREWFVPKWSKELQVSCAGKQWMDCVLPTATKGVALGKIQEMLGIKKEETMVFGDNLNDISMLQQAKYSFAVENARQEVKDVARAIVPSYKEDGILKELKKNRKTKWFS